MPAFADLDNLYHSTVQKLPVEERLLYCTRRLETAQLVLKKSALVLGNYEKNELRRLINAVEAEIKKLQSEIS